METARSAPIDSASRRAFANPAISQCMYSIFKRIPPPSAHDVARLAGVSQAAVSRAFTAGASIAKDTKEKVLRAANSIGYRPNLHARSLIKGESGIVGTVIGSPRNAIFMAALGALSKGLSRAGKHLLVSSAEGYPTGDEHIKDLLNYRVDALLLMATSISSKLIEQCRHEAYRSFHSIGDRAKPMLSPA